MRVQEEDCKKHEEEKKSCVLALRGKAGQVIDFNQG